VKDYASELCERWLDEVRIDPNRLLDVIREALARASQAAHERAFDLGLKKDQQNSLVDAIRALGAKP
jgi:hypothetical protein